MSVNARQSKVDGKNDLGLYQEVVYCIQSGVSSCFFAFRSTKKRFPVLECASNGSSPARPWARSKPSFGEVLG